MLQHVVSELDTLIRGKNMEMAKGSDELYVVQLEIIIVNLRQKLDDVKNQLAEALKQIPDSDSINAFVLKISRKTKRVYGWKAAYIEASQISGCRSVDHGMLREWIESGIVPSWAFDQIDRMVFKDHLTRGRCSVWNDDQKNFLAQTYRSDPSQSDADIARVCTIEFGYTVTENAIKGALYRLRQQNILTFRGMYNDHSSVTHA
jgi:hypothetical protein